MATATKTRKSAPSSRKATKPQRPLSGNVLEVAHTLIQPGDQTGILPPDRLWRIDVIHWDGTRKVSKPCLPSQDATAYLNGYNSLRGHWLAVAREVRTVEVEPGAMLFQIAKAADGSYRTFRGEPGKPVYRLCHRIGKELAAPFSEYTDRAEAERLAADMNKGARKGEMRVEITGPHKASALIGGAA